MNIETLCSPRPKKQKAPTYLYNPMRYLNELEYKAGRSLLHAKTPNKNKNNNNNNHQQQPFHQQTNSLPPLLLPAQNNNKTSKQTEIVNDNTFDIAKTSIKSIFPDLKSPQKYYNLKEYSNYKFVEWDTKAVFASDYELKKQMNSVNMQRDSLKSLSFFKKKPIFLREKFEIEDLVSPRSPNPHTKSTFQQKSTSEKQRAIQSQIYNTQSELRNTSDLFTVMYRKPEVPNLNSFCYMNPKYQGGLQFKTILSSKNKKESLQIQKQFRNKCLQSDNNSVVKEQQAIDYSNAIRGILKKLRHFSKQYSYFGIGKIKTGTILQEFLIMVEMTKTEITSMKSTTFSEIITQKTKQQQENKFISLSVLKNRFNEYFSSSQKEIADRILLSIEINPGKNESQISWELFSLFMKLIIKNEASLQEKINFLLNFFNQDKVNELPISQFLCIIRNVLRKTDCADLEQNQPQSEQLYYFYTNLFELLEIFNFADDTINQDKLKNCLLTNFIRINELMDLIISIY